MRRLALRRETLSELSATELSGVFAGQARTTDCIGPIPTLDSCFTGQWPTLDRCVQ